MSRIHLLVCSMSSLLLRRLLRLLCRRLLLLCSTPLLLSPPLLLSRRAERKSLTDRRLRYRVAMGIHCLQTTIHLPYCGLLIHETPPRWGILGCSADFCDSAYADNARYPRSQAIIRDLKPTRSMAKTFHFY